MRHEVMNAGWRTDEPQGNAWSSSLDGRWRCVMARVTGTRLDEIKREGHGGESFDV